VCGYNAHVGAIVSDGDKDGIWQQVGDLACDFERDFPLQLLLRALGVFVSCRHSRPQLGQLRVYAETDRLKFTAADVHVVVVVVVVAGTFIGFYVPDVNRAIFDVVICGCSNKSRDLRCC